MKHLSILLASLLAVSNAYAEDQGKETWQDWLKRTDVNVDLSKGSRPNWSIETVQPLYQSTGKQDTVFTQLRGAVNDRFGERRNTFNLGLGYRRLLSDNNILLGGNLFYDVETKYSIKRWSFGAEARWNAFDLYFNKYYGISDWTSTNNGAQEKPLDGYDVDLAMQVPYLPWAKVHAINYRYDKERASEDLRGNKFSVEGQLTSNLILEIGRDNHADNLANDGNFAMIRFSLAGQNEKRPTAFNKLVSANAFDARDMSEHTLDRVRRNNIITVERRSSGGVVIARGD
jgi:hypothetical protein